MQKDLEPMEVLFKMVNGETEEPERTVLMLAKKMKPEKEVWESLGFVFEDIDDDCFYKATLPEGWNVETTNHNTCQRIVDEDENLRGELFSKGTGNNRKAVMHLYRKYDVRQRYIGEETEIYFGNIDEDLFVAGRVRIDWSDPKEAFDKQKEEKAKLEKLAKEYAMEEYPDYEDVTAYWDTKEKHHTRKLSIKN